ncbi:MAG: ABC transporter ATP-binding protein [Clostridia bacterium]
MEPYISVKDVTFCYPDGTKALFGVNMDIYKGEMLAIIGQNGSGKTTIVKHFNGLLKPTSGDVFVDGKSVKAQTAGKLAGKVGYVYQNPSLQLFRSSVREEIAFGLRLLKKSETEIAKIVEENLRLVGLWEKVDDYPFFLSMGEKQRVAIAAVLALGPEVLIVDEPTTGQDFKRAYQFLELFDMLNKKANKTIIFITHEMRFTTEFSHRTIVMANGKVWQDGETKAVFNDVAKLNEALVAPPEIVQLAAAAKSLGISEDVLTVNDLYDELKRLALKE